MHSVNFTLFAHVFLPELEKEKKKALLRLRDKAVILKNKEMDL